ncbi:MAG: helix-turn-helix domain-containing protein [Muribaculaceae bacterium]
MFPAFDYLSEDFSMTYCLMSREYAEVTFYSLSKELFVCQYLSPLIIDNGEMDIWFRMLLHADEKYSDYSHKDNLITDIVNGIYIIFINLWKLQYGDKNMKHDLKRSEELCIKFYNLVFDNFTVHRDIKFYADSLCISPNYLAMIIRGICDESPKDAIDCQLISEIKYILNNTSLSIKQIAQHLNFPDTSYMCSYFKKKTGMSLSEFRAKRNK